ncbi:hypothetical protein TNCV_850861 [Trichonephila clavipes]|nr:hypothetical protein TNCV_850861 [Trichonephila clavipes]
MAVSQSLLHLALSGAIALYRFTPNILKSFSILSSQRVRGLPFLSFSSILEEVIFLIGNESLYLYRCDIYINQQEPTRDDDRFGVVAKILVFGSEGAHF